jgi:hypothetical protein
MSEKNPVNILTTDLFGGEARRKETARKTKT